MRTLSFVFLSLCLAFPCLADANVEKRPTQCVGGLTDVKDAGSITGVVTFAGPKPEVKAITDIAGNGFCKNCYKEGELPKYDEFVIGTDGKQDTLANVLVYVSKGLEGRKFDVPKDPVLLDQVGCVYTPHVVAVMVGQTLAVKNSDATMHNVMASPSENSPFNFGMPAQNQVINRTFKQPEMKVKVRCFMHPWMVGYVHVLEHPYFAVTGPDGKFEIRGLPAGEYEISVLHESGALAATPETATVKVTAGKAAEAGFEYRMKNGK